MTALTYQVNILIRILISIHTLKLYKQILEIITTVGSCTSKFWFYSKMYNNIYSRILTFRTSKGNENFVAIVREFETSGLKLHCLNEREWLLGGSEKKMRIHLPAWTWNWWTACSSSSISPSLPSDTRADFSPLMDCKQEQKFVMAIMILSQAYSHCTPQFSKYHIYMYVIINYNKIIFIFVYYALLNRSTIKLMSSANNCKVYFYWILQIAFKLFVSFVLIKVVSSAELYHFTKSAKIWNTFSMSSSEEWNKKDN